MGPADGDRVPLVERGEQLADLEGLYAELDQTGDGAFGLITGPAGIGKSTLLHAAREQGREAGFRVLTAQGGELERDFAHGMVRQLFERALVELPDDERSQLLADAAGLAAPALGLGPGAPVERPGEGQFAVLHGLYWLTANLAEAGPVLLAIDDLHWSDTPSLAYVLHMMSRLEGLPILILAAARPGESASDRTLLDQIAEASEHTIVPLPLTDQGLAELIEASMGERPEQPFAEAVMTASSGNPFFATEIMRTLNKDSIAPRADAAARVLDMGPEAVARSLSLRLTALSENCLPLAQAVSIFGSQAELDRAAELAGLTEQAARDAATELAAVEILNDSIPLTFSHPVLRRAAYEEIPLSERTALHARAARILTDAGESPAQVAPHLLATHPTGSEDVVNSLRKAANLALGQGAVQSAKTYLERAMAEPITGALRTDLIAELGRVEWLAGEPMRAIEHLRRAIEQTSEAGVRAERALVLARALLQAHEPIQAIETLDAERERAAGHDDLLAERLTAEAISMGLSHPATVHSAQERILAVDLTGRPTAGLRLNQLNRATYETMVGTADAAADLIEQVLSDQDFVEREGPDSFAIGIAMWSLCLTDRLDLVDRFTKSLLASAIRNGSAFGVAAQRMLIGTCAYRRGQIVAAEIEARSTVDAGPGFLAPFAHAILALAQTERGSFGEAEQTLKDFEAAMGTPIERGVSLALYARGQLRTAQGEFEGALDDFNEMGLREQGGEPDRPPFAWRLGAAVAHLGLHHPERALDLAREQVERAEHWGAPSVIGAALRVEGIAQGRDGVDSLARAVEILADAPAELEHARALVDYGSALRRAGTRAKAREPLREGLALAQTCGAILLAERASEELATAGAAPRRRQFSGLDSLTASERRVARLVSEGKTNREVAQELFVTLKTVENHLSRVYSKLDISSRRDLPAALAGVYEGDEAVVS